MAANVDCIQCGACLGSESLGGPLRPRFGALAGAILPRVRGTLCDFARRSFWFSGIVLHAGPSLPLFSCRILCQGELPYEHLCTFVILSFWVLSYSCPIALLA